MMLLISSGWSALSKISSQRRYGSPMRSASSTAAARALDPGVRGRVPAKRLSQGGKRRAHQRGLVGLDPSDLVVATVPMRVLDGHSGLPDATHPLQRVWQDRGDVVTRLPVTQSMQDGKAASEVLVPLGDFARTCGNPLTPAQHSPKKRPSIRLRARSSPSSLAVTD